MTVDGPIAILGCGTIGASWTALFLASGRSVQAWDPDPARRAALRPRVAAILPRLRRLGHRGRGRLRVFATLKRALVGAAHVQENAPERIATKHALYADVERGAPPEAVIASSTSSFTWSDLAAPLARKARLVIAHPFNPPHLIPLVEFYGTDDDAVASARQLYESAGRVCIRLKREAPGHVANRLSSALWREAVHIVAEGIADVADVDRALVEGPGLRWAVQGAHLAYHLGGGAGGIAAYLEHLGPSQERRWATLGSPKLDARTRALLVDGVLRVASGRTVAELEAERDTHLEALLRARRRAATRSR